MNDAKRLEFDNRAGEAFLRQRWPRGATVDSQCRMLLEIMCMRGHSIAGAAWVYKAKAHACMPSTRFDAALLAGQSTLAACPRPPSFAALGCCRCSSSIPLVRGIARASTTSGMKRASKIATLPCLSGGFRVLSAATRNNPWMF